MRTSWSTAKTDPAELRGSLISALRWGHHDAYIISIPNREAALPILKVNPALDKVENWTFSYGIYVPDLSKHRYLNETERMLTEQFDWSWKEKAPKLRTHQTPWVHFWKPKDGISAYVPEDLDRVWVVAFNFQEGELEQYQRYLPEKIPLCPTCGKIMLAYEKPYNDTRRIPRHVYCKQHPEIGYHPDTLEVVVEIKRLPHEVSETGNEESDG